MRTYTAVVTSICLHLLVYLSLALWEQLAELIPFRDRMTHIQQEQKDQTVDLVLLENSPDSLKPDQTKAPYLAAQTQRVKEQTQARFKGATANRDFPSRPSDFRPQKTKAQMQAATSEMGEVKLNATDRLNKALATGISTLSESIPENIKYGDFTALNTDQYLFYSFFSRIAPRIRFNWEDGVEQVVESLMFRNFNIREEKTFVTEVEVRLDRKGYYQGTSVYRSSGVPGLDQAVARAFEMSAPFINPPTEMVKDDGMIHLYYAFHVYFSPKYFARPNSQSKD